MNGKVHAATALHPGGGGGILRFSLDRKLDEPRNLRGRRGEQSYCHSRSPLTLLAGISG